MDETNPKKRGRPARPAMNALGRYLRARREARGWTVRELARRVGLSESSAAYISQLERGSKVPSMPLAFHLAEQLGDAPGVFRLWALIGRRSDPAKAAFARRELARLLDDPSLVFDPRFAPPAPFYRPGPSFDEEQRGIPGAFGIPPREPRAPESMPSHRGLAARFARAGWSPDEAAAPAAESPRVFRIRLLPEGADPDAVDASAPSAPEFVRVDVDAVAAGGLERPFAYRLGAEGASRVTTVLREGDLVVITRAPGPVTRHEVHAVRHEGRIVLTHAAWNGRQLLLLPDPDRSDFAVVAAPDREALSRLVVGHVARVIRPG